MNIDIEKIKYLPHSRSKAFLHEGKVIKLESELYDPEKEKLANIIARSCGIYIPKADIEFININGDNHRALIKDYVKGDSFLTLELFVNKLGNPFDRIDFLYILFLDILIANLDNKTFNLVLERSTDTLVPIDLDEVFCFKTAPMSLYGIEIILNRYIVDPISGFHDINPILFAGVLNEFIKKIDYKLLRSIDFELLDRAAMMQQVIIEFMKTWRFGNKYIFGETHANSSR